MFIGFIAIIVVLLIIVAVMSTSGTSGSGGVDQTKASKILGEISALQQAAGFYKTVTPNNDYTGITVDELVSVGVIDSGDLGVLTVTNAVSGTPELPSATNANIVFGGVTHVGAVSGAIASLTPAIANATPTNLIVSKSIPGLFYNITSTNGGTVNIEVMSTATVYESDGELTLDQDFDGSTLSRSVERAYEKFSATSEALVTDEDGDRTTTPFLSADANVVLTFR